jgi:hypothetical protein
LKPTGDDEHQRERKHEVVAPAREDGLRKRTDAERAGRPVEHGHPVEQHARGERAKHEVLHGCLRRDRRVALERHHRVEREREQLEPQVEGEQVVRRDHHHHAERREQRQHEELAAEEPARGDVAARVDQHRRHARVGKQLEDVGHRVVHEHAAEGGLRLQRRAEGEQGEREAARQRELRQPVSNRAVAVGHEQIHDQDHAHRAEQEDLGIGGRERGYEGHSVLYGSLPCATCASRS